MVEVLLCIAIVLLLVFIGVYTYVAIGMRQIAKDLADIAEDFDV